MVALRLRSPLYLGEQGEIGAGGLGVADGRLRSSKYHGEQGEQGD